MEKSLHNLLPTHPTHYHASCRVMSVCRLVKWFSLLLYVCVLCVCVCVCVCDCVYCVAPTLPQVLICKTEL